MADNRLFKRTTFTFIGDVVTGKELVSTKRLSDTSKWFRTRLNFGVKCENNTQFLNIEHLHEPNNMTCKIFFEDGTSQDIALKDTINPSIISKVSDMNKIIIDLEQDFQKKTEYTQLYFKRRTHQIKEDKTDDDIAKIKEYTDLINELANNRVEFIHMKDVINFLENSLGLIKDCKIKVTGNVKPNFYNGKNNLQYIPTRIELVPKDTPSQLKIFVDFFFDKDGISDMEEEKRMIFNGYMGSVTKKADRLYPLTTILDYSKVNTDNEEELNVLKYLKSQFAIKDKEQIHKIGLELNIINGSQVVEFDETCLTDNQLMGIRLGLNTIEDFRPKGTVYGHRIQELRIAKPDLRNYPEGAIEVFDIDELENYIATDDSDKKNTEVRNNQTETKEVKDSNEDLMAKLFGQI